MMRNIEEPRILVIDDNDQIHGDFRKILSARKADDLADMSAELFGETVQKARISFQIDSAQQGQEGHAKVKQACLDGHPYAMAFVDMRMPPGWDGMETIQHLFADDPDIQVVICTAFSDYSWDQMLEKLGMNDRVLILKKPFDTIEVCQLAAALTEKWKLKRQAKLKLDELESMVHDRTRELQHAAMHDRLTGLPNRACLMERLKRSFERSREIDGKIGLIFLDFDRFKLINDSLGHEAGDNLLIEIAARMQSVLRLRSVPETTFAARLGGDEFVVAIDPLTSVEEAIAVADDLLAVFQTPYNLYGHEVHSSASMGIVVGPTDYRLPSELLRDADTAMYKAKTQGKCRYVLFDVSMREEAIAKLTFEADLHNALQRKELRLVYQPIVSLQSGKIHGVEALLRWDHPTLGTINPADFIPLSEETGLILPIGRWVMATACSQLKEWLGRIPGRELSININLSRKQLNDPGLLNFVKELIECQQLPPQLVGLEVTESVVMDSAGANVNILNELKGLGVALHMDDFGTGYSSLSCLHTMPLKQLKIDRSFIFTMVGRRDYIAVVNAIVQLAHNLGVQVVAEGIETKEQVSVLQALDCDFGQGYYFSRPVDVEEMTRQLLASAIDRP